MTETIVNPISTRALIKCGLLVFILVAVQVPIVLVDALAHNGCTKYVPLSYVRELVTLSWQVWTISLGLHLIVLSLFMSNFLRRPRALVAKPALIAWVCFVAWKTVSLAADIKHASRCGEARDFVYPEKLPWLSLDLLFLLGLVGWLATIVVATIATSHASSAKSNLLPN